MKPPSEVTLRRRVAAAADGEDDVDGEAEIVGEAPSDGAGDVDDEAEGDGEDADPDEEGAVEGGRDDGGDPVGAVATEQAATITASATERRIWIGERTVIVSPGRTRQSASKA
jgi:hypothetical protein